MRCEGVWRGERTGDKTEVGEKKKKKKKKNKKEDPVRSDREGCVCGGVCGGLCVCGGVCVSLGNGAVDVLLYVLTDAGVRLEYACVCE